MKTQAEMNEVFGDIPESLTNTVEIVEKVAAKRFRLSFGYMAMNDVMKAVKDMGLQPSGQDFGMACSMTVSVRLSLVDSFLDRISGVEGCEAVEV